MAVDLGKIGIWHLATGWNPELAAAVEKLGFGAIWVGGSPSGDLRIAEELLDATSAIAVATGIVNMWRDDARTVGASYHRIAAKHRGRFLLGVGVGHPERTQVYQKPYDKIMDYLDELDELDEAGVPAEDRALAALGPKVLRLAGERTAGVHPYLTTPEHTRRAREILGDGPLLAPEQKVVLDTVNDHVIPQACDHVIPQVVGPDDVLLGNLLPVTVDTLWAFVRPVAGAVHEDVVAGVDEPVEQ